MFFFITCLIASISFFWSLVWSLVSLYILKARRQTPNQTPKIDILRGSPRKPSYTIFRGGLRKFWGHAQILGTRPEHAKGLAVEGAATEEAEGAEEGEGRRLEHDARRQLPGEAGRLRGGDGGVQGGPAGAQGGQEIGKAEALGKRRRTGGEAPDAGAELLPASRRRSPTLHPTRRRPALTLATAALALRIRRGGRRPKRARRAQPRRRARHLPSPCGDYRKSFAKRRRRRRRSSPRRAATASSCLAGRTPGNGAGWPGSPWAATCTSVSPTGAGTSARRRSCGDATAARRARSRAAANAATLSPAWRRRREARATSASGGSPLATTSTFASAASLRRDQRQGGGGAAETAERRPRHWRPRWRASCRPVPRSGSAHCMPSR